jgi:hypothetical protein
MGLLLVTTGEQPRRKGIAYLCGAFLVETSILLFSGLVLNGTVDTGGGVGRSFLVIRILLGLALIVMGLRMRRPPKSPAPEVPKSLERLQGLSPAKAFVGGALLADYQGPVIASLALAAADVSLGGRLIALSMYTLLASGIPIAIFIVVLRSRNAMEKMNDATAWVMKHRRQLASWFGLVLGTLLVGDAALGLVLT